MDNKNSNLKAYQYLIYVVKYLPVITQIIIVFNLFDYYYSFSSTMYLCSFIGYSILWCLLMILLSYVLKFCIWHRLLIYNMIFNASCEFIIISTKNNAIIENIMAFSSMITTLFIISSIVTRFKFGCRK